MCKVHLLDPSSLTRDSGEGSADAIPAEGAPQGSGWGMIYEGDDAFDRLTLWEMDESGERLTGLKDRGVGAIFLGSPDTPFDLKDSSNQLEGRIARHGVFLREDGTAGTVLGGGRDCI